MECNVTNCTSVRRSSVYETYSTAYIVALSLLAGVIFFVNLVIVYLFFTRDALRTKTNTILVSLACTDLVNGIVAIPLQISCNVHVREQSLRLASMVMVRFVAVSTMFHILAVTIERHICIVHPLRYNSLVTKRRTIEVLCTIWSVSTFYAVIGLSWLGLADDFNHLAQPPRLSNSRLLQFEFAYTVIGFVFCFFIPVAIMSYSFATILREISRHNRRELELVLDPKSPGEERARTRFDRKPVLIFMTMLLLFVLNWTSWYVKLFILAVTPQHYKSMGGTLTDYLRYSTSAFNPLLYSLIKKDFRQALTKFLVQAKMRMVGFSRKRMTAEQDTNLSPLQV